MITTRAPDGANKQDLAMILYHAISISLRPTSKLKEMPISSCDNWTDILAFLNSAFVFAVFGCDEYSFRNLFISQLFSPSGMDAWTLQTWTYHFSVLWGQISLSQQNALHEARNVDISP